MESEFVDKIGDIAVTHHGGRSTVAVLDHGYVRLVQSWGSDRAIIEAARMSTDKGFLGWEPEAYYVCPKCGYELKLAVNGKDYKAMPYLPACGQCAPALHVLMSLDETRSHAGDAKLLKYLYDNWHHTPFEMAGLTIEVQAPIFVFREWHRHRTQSYSELSARYTAMPDLNYVPTVERLLMAGGKNKQAQGTGAQLTEEQAQNFQRVVSRYYQTLQTEYQAFLDCGVPKELARILLPVGRYSRMCASANLRNWIHFLTLRMDAHAQWEIRQYANVVGDIIAELFPRSWALFNVTAKSLETRLL